MRTVGSASGTHRGGGERSSGMCTEGSQPRSVDFEAESEAQTTLEVEGNLFRISNNELEQQSQVFRDMFSLPSNRPGSDKEESGDSSIVRLDGIPLQKFQCFWQVLYPKSANTPPPLTKDELISALELADMWEFPKIRKEIIQRLTPLFKPSDALQRIHLGHRFDIPSWTLKGYFDLVWRHDPLTPEEGKQLGIDAVTKLARAREIRVKAECTRRAYAWGYNENGARLKWCSSSQKLVDEKLRQFVCDVFKIPLEH